MPCDSRQNNDSSRAVSSSIDSTDHLGRSRLESLVRRRPVLINHREKICFRDSCAMHLRTKPSSADAAFKLGREQQAASRAGTTICTGRPPTNPGSSPGESYQSTLHTCVPRQQRYVSWSAKGPNTGACTGCRASMLPVAFGSRKQAERG